MSLRLAGAACLVGAALLGSGPLRAQTPQPVPRPTPVAGSIVDAKGGEELQFTRESVWRRAWISQDLIGGDTLRTGPIGTLGIRFADQTTIRVGRESTLLVDQVAGSNGDTRLELPAGNIWARAARGGSGVVVKTPAAAATIRGTDWSLSVDGSGRTGLIVLEGVVEFSNPQGSVTVRQGEAATAAIGQAPTKVILVRPRDREQMLFHLSLRGAFTWLPATPLEGRDLRKARARLETIPAERRTSEDWLVLAEVAMKLDGRATAREALAQARAKGLTGSQRSRADLVEGLLQGATRRWHEAAALFARAEPGLTGRRRIAAAYGRYIAASLAEPGKVLPEPRVAGGDAYAVLARAYVAGFARDLDAASAIVEAAPEAYRSSADLAVFRAQLDLTLDRRERLKAAVETARAIDPDSPNVLLAEGYYKGDIESDLAGALAALERAARIAPGDADIWNAIGLVHVDLDEPIAAEAALKRAIQEDPDDPVPYGNYGILLLDQSRLAEAEAMIDKALELEPGFYVAYTAKGRLLLQRGEMGKAMDYLLAGTAANPAYAQGLLISAIAAYENNDLTVARQAFDNADRLDPNDPVTALARTAVAIDQRQADEAIENAREAVRRFRNRGGYFAPLAATRQGGSYLSDAYRLLSLDAWGRYYGDRVANAFTATAYFDQAQVGRRSPIFARPDILQLDAVPTDGAAFNLTTQGLLLDPLAVSGRLGRIDLLRRPFLDAEVGGSLIAPQGGKVGWADEATVSGFTNLPVPTSFTASAGTVKTSDLVRGAGETTQRVAAFVGSAPSAENRFLAFGAANFGRPTLLTPVETLLDYDRQQLKTYQAGLGWSHSFADRNVVSAMVVSTRAEESRQQQLFQSFSFFGLPAVQGVVQLRQARVDTSVFALSHLFGWGDLTWRGGVEGQVGRARALGSEIQSLDVPGLGSAAQSTDSAARSTFSAGLVYGDVAWQPNDWFQGEAGWVGYRSDSNLTVSKDTGAPRVGIGISPFDNQWLRAAWRRDVVLPSGFSLSPQTVVGLVPTPLPTDLNGRTTTLDVRWDAEWTRHLFTAVEYQRQDVRDLSIAVPGTLGTYSIPRGTFDVVSATANIWLGNGVGVFGTVGSARSDASTGSVYGRTLPFVPETFGRVGLTFVHPSRLQVTVVENIVGERRSDLLGSTLGAFATTDATLSWETPDRRFVFGLAALNIFDRHYQIAAPVPASLNPDGVAAAGIPGVRRTFSGSLKVRF